MTRENEFFYQHPHYAPGRIDGGSVVGGLWLWAVGLAALAVICLA